MVFYEAHIKHTEETLTALAHMQYDLFCTGNRIGRTAIAGSVRLRRAELYAVVGSAADRLRQLSHFQQIRRREPHREEARPADKGVRRRVPLLQIYF